MIKMSQPHFVSLQMFTYGMRAIVMSNWANDHEHFDAPQRKELRDASERHLEFVHDCLNNVDVEDKQTGVRIQCTTNLDDFKRSQWPTQLPHVPSVGQWIYTEDSRRRLRIHELSWLPSGELLVELHK